MSEMYLRDLLRHVAPRTEMVIFWAVVTTKYPAKLLPAFLSAKQFKKQMNPIA